ncbi:MAG: hypothetical protein AVDCRST_MAG77-4545 [uncultured Chloroflexi bacterium]|uniref:Uncharacterized protein n=1 Tax=uncultured Chloroflexota bacterium TaxID=166587 RepID=A0A6J4JW39_9CHLR|nr:MAG: hypothetical protein AVDCRST_MAG77-4545 [uncultured Chloroflexota bacterium]
MNASNPTPPKPTGPRRRLPTTSLGRRRLAMIGVAGESVGVLAGAAGWRISGEPAWIIMAVVSFALAIVMLRHV